MCLVLFIVVGCGGGEKSVGRRSVSGTVLMDGSPLNHGAIDFRPDGPGTHLVGGGSVIKDGKFSIPTDRGLVPGKYKVSISAPDSASPDVQGKSPEEQMKAVATTTIKERLPAKFNSATELSAEVKSSGANEFHFKVESVKD
jgi:hypothetical protein